MKAPAVAQIAIVAALAQHSAYLYRANTGAANELLAVFNKDTKALLASLAEQLEDLTDAERMALASASYSTARLKAIKATVDDWYKSLTATLPEVFTAGAVALAGHEVNYITEAMAMATGDAKDIALTGEKVFKSAKKLPVTGGQLIDQMFSKIAVQAQDTVWNTIRQGVVDGQSNSEIIKALRGKAEFKYQDSVLAPTRQAIETEVRTARNHISNNAYMETYAALGVEEVVVVATLDSKVSVQCAARDGTRYKINENFPRPPYHRRCRTVIAPVFDKDLIGNRPAKGSDGTTQVNANTTFSSWFKNQSAEFQKDWLGESRYKLYKTGGYELSRFVDPKGQTYTLDELKIRDKRTFSEVFG